MIRKEFNRIATNENGTFRFRDKDIAIGGGVRSPYVVYLLTLEYNGYTINIKNETGLAYCGLILCTIKANGKPLEFERTTRSHFSTLFRRSKHRFRIKTDYVNVKTFLQQSPAVKELSHCQQRHI